MSELSENRILRWEMMSEIKNKDGMIDRILKIREGQRLRLAEQDMAIREMERRLTCYENPDSTAVCQQPARTKKKTEEPS